MQTIASNGGASTIGENFDKLGLDTISNEERLSILQTIASNGGASIIGENFEKLGLRELTDEQRLKFLEVSEEELLSAYPFLEKLYEQNPQELQQYVVEKLQNRLDSLEMQSEAQLSLAKKIYHAQGRLRLQIEDSLMQAAIQLVTIEEDEGETGPFNLYRKLQQLAKEPTLYMPPKLEIDGVQAAINLQHLKAIAVKIDRTDLPKNVSQEAFNAFFSQLKNKVVDKDGAVTLAAQAALNKLQTNWAEVSVPIEEDPDKLLSNLIAKTEGVVSETEAKWKAVLSNILDKSSASQEGAFFSEQEEAFINTMIAVQNCTGGKMYGIMFAYEQLSPKYRYQGADVLAPQQTLAQFMAEESKNKALEQFATFLEKMPKEEDPVAFLCAQSKEEAWARKLTGWTTELFADDPLLNETYLSTDDFIDFEISEAGAQAIVKQLKIKADTDASRVLKVFLSQSIQKALEEQLGGETPLMQELVDVEKVEDIEEVPHQAIYLKNLIGPVLGATQTVTFDMHTGTLYESLVSKSREQVLEIFFKHFTPETLANALMKDLKSATPEEKQSLQQLLPEEQYWSAPATLNQRGALELLRRFQYVV